MKITSAEPSPNNKDMLRVHLDDAYAFSIPETAWRRHGLDGRTELSAEEVGELRQTVIRQAGREAAVRYLSIKDRTGAGLCERLQRAGFDAEAAALAVEDMVTLGYVDDRRYARRLISDLMQRRAASRKAIRMGLRSKGIANEVIEEVLDELEQDDEETAIRGVRRKFGKYDLSDPAVERKAVAYLAHRGFNGETVRVILRRLREDTQAFPGMFEEDT